MTIQHFLRTFQQSALLAALALAVPSANEAQDAWVLSG
jgi:hypothetical protein